MPNSGGSPPRPIVVIGLDGVPPEFIFSRFREVMPHTSKLVEHGTRASLRTTDPPISVPAWPVMFTGVDPGTLGFYGFRHRTRNSYTETYVPRSNQTPVPSVWELASRAGLRVGVIGMPLGYPPVHVNGFFISDFLTPPGSRDYTHPEELAAELESKYGPYPFDVVFRSDERKELVRQILEMTRTRFRIAEDLIQRERWDLFAIHEIGSDRLNHAYWKYFDPTDPKFSPGNPYEKVAEEFYRVLDDEIGRLLSHVEEGTRVLIASDHGSMAMRGCFCVNQWLADRGYLALRSIPAPGTQIEKASVDWGRTTIWGSGGYYARIFFNIRGREAHGIVSQDQIGALRKRLEQDLEKTKDPDGRPLRFEILDPKQIYHEVRGDAPDLIVYFGDLKWRSAGSLGYPSLFLDENDTGPDDAVHSVDGVFLWSTLGATEPGSDIPEQQIRDVAPTILHELGVDIPAHIQGKPIALRPPVPSPAPQVAASRPAQS